MLCVIPIENMTELNNNHTTKMVEKAGQRKMDIVFNKFDQYYNIYRSEIVKLQNIHIPEDYNSASKIH